jgi:hypothetical protein
VAGAAAAPPAVAVAIPGVDAPTAVESADATQMTGAQLLAKHLAE